MLALDAAPAERERLIRREAAGDEASCAEALALLRAHERAGSFIDRGLEARQVHRLLELPVFEPGTVLGDFRLERKLGAGSFGAVYLATQLSLQRQVAVKVTPDRGSEGRVMASLEHDHIVRVFSQSVFPERGVRLLCMEYVAGSDLRRALSSQRTLESVLRLGEQLASALAYAHARHVVHLDLKPENILLSPSGSPRLVDFNIAWRPDAAASERNPLGGTPGYMAPEQERFLRERSEETIGPAADIYSLAAVLREVSQAAGEWENLRPTLLSCFQENPTLRPSAAALERSLRGLRERVVLRKSIAHSLYETRRVTRLTPALLGALGLLPALWGAALVVGLFPAATPLRGPASAPFAHYGIECWYSLFYCVTLIALTAVALRARLRKHLAYAPEALLLVGTIAMLAILYQSFRAVGMGHLPISPALFLRFSRLTTIGNALLTGAMLLLLERQVWWHALPSWLKEGEGTKAAVAEISAGGKRLAIVFGMAIALPLFVACASIGGWLRAPATACVSLSVAMAAVALFSTQRRRALLQRIGVVPAPLGNEGAGTGHGTDHLG